MSKEQHSSLDRLYARYYRQAQRVTAPDAWSPPWQPRGRWWMRGVAPSFWRTGASAASRVWRRLVRPSRGA